MRNTLVIAGREIAAFFLQPIAYVVMTVFLLLGGWFFFALLRRFDLVQQMYAWGARNCELHFCQVRGEFQPFRGVSLPSFLPETG